MAPATTRMKQKLAQNKPTKPAQEKPKKTTITRPILTGKSKTAPPKTNKPIAASAPKPTKPLSSIIPTNEQLTSSNRSSSKPASVPPTKVQASPRGSLSSRSNATFALASTSSNLKPKGVLSKSDHPSTSSLRMDTSARKEKKNTARKHAAQQAVQRSNSGQVQSTARGGATNEMQALHVAPGNMKGSKREMVEYVSNMNRRSIAASMANSMHTRWRSNSVDAARTRKDVDMGDDRGDEEGEAQEQRKKQKEKEKQKQKQTGQMQQMRRGGQDREDEDEDEEKEEEEAAAGPEEATDDVDDDDLDDGSVQADGDGDGNGDGDVPMEEAGHPHDEEGGQEALDHGIDHLDMDDGSVQMDREGNITMHDAEDEHQTVDFSLQEDLEEDGEDADMEDDNDGEPEDADMIPESERKDEVGDGGQAAVEEGSDVEWDGFESPGSAIDEEEEEEDEEREDEREGEEEEGEEYEPEEIEQEGATDGEAGGEEEGENEEEGEGIEDEEGDQEEGDQAEGDEEEVASEYEDEADADPPASAEGHAEHTSTEKEGNKSPDEQVKARIYKTVKELVQNIPSRHFVYCRTLDKDDDITHVAFKAYDVDGRMDRFNTQTLQNSANRLGRLLDIARGIYEKQNGWEFAHLKRDFAFSVPAKRAEKKTTKKKKATRAKKEQAPTHKGLVTISGRFDNEGGDDDRQWDRYIQRLADEAAEILGPSPPVRFKPEPEFMWIWTEKSLFPDYDLKLSKKPEKYAGRLLVILAGLDHEDGEFAFSCDNRCHYFDAKMKPCLIATLGDSGAFVNALPLTSGYRIGLVYRLLFTKKDMIEQNTAFNTVDYLNDYEKQFLDGLETWSKAGNMKRNGIHWMVYYILKKQPVDAQAFIPSADLTPAQKLQLTWLYKLCGQMPGKCIGGKKYDWPLLVDLAVLSCRNFVKETKDGKTEKRLGFEVEWTTDADCIENDDWERDDSAEGMEVKQEEIINFDDFGSTGKDSYLCIRLNIA
ncbi:hypothetical protein QBC45DRAFT_396845 [Copromyces sp. CBS 386.78]|nr:hypothetical protein QBC45DRAFT_396845 [Copromyces sp. CBS 386.78]